MHQGHPKSLLVLAGLFIIGFAGCGKKQQPQNIITRQYIADQSDVRVTVGELSTTGGVNRLASTRVLKRYQPLEITIENNSREDLTLIKDNLDLRLVSPKRVARHAHANLLLSFLWPPYSMTPAKANAQTAYSIAGATACGVAVATAPFKFTAEICLGAGIIALATVPLAIITNLILTVRDNKKITREFMRLSTDLSTPLTIAAHSTVSKVVFVPRLEYKWLFDLVLTNRRTYESMLFEVDMNQRVLSQSPNGVITPISPAA